MSVPISATKNRSNDKKRSAFFAAATWFGSRSTTLMILIPIAVALIFFAYPLLQMFRLSFTDFVGGSGELFDNYRWFLGSETQITILKRTFGVAALVTISCLLVGFPYAYLMTLVGPGWRLVMVAFVLLPFWSNLVVRTFAWVVLLRDSGPIQTILHTLGIDGVKLIGNVTGVTIGSVQVLLPFLVLPLFASLVSIDRGLLTAAHSLGARPWKAFVKVYLPLAMPGIISACSIVFILTLGFFFTPALLGSPRNSLVAQQLVTQINELLAFGRGGAIALIVLVITLALLGIAGLVSRKFTLEKSR